MLLKSGDDPAPTEANLTHRDIEFMASSLMEGGDLLDQDALTTAASSAQLIDPDKRVSSQVSQHSRFRIPSIPIVSRF